MPELPEVETIARDLRALVTGARVVGARSNWAKTLRSHEAESFAAAVSGRQIVAIARSGKQLLVMLAPAETAEAAAPAETAEAAAPAEVAAPAEAEGPEGGQGAQSVAGLAIAHPIDPGPAEPAVMTVHLKMTGQLFVVPAATPQDRHVHAVLELADGRELRFRDIRKFGRIGLYRRDPATGRPPDGEADGVLPRGAEPLSDAFTRDLLVAMLATRRGRIKTLLLNQDFLAGVGNIYADEALWGSRIHPLREARSLKSDEIGRLYAALLDVLEEAVANRGSSVDDYTAPQGDGSMQEHLAVYQRAGEPCLRCGRSIRRVVVGGRSTHFCGWCQRLPAGQRTGAARAAGVAAAADHTRRGPRWTELSGEGVVGRTVDEETRARRVAANRRAAAARRASARAGGTA